MNQGHQPQGPLVVTIPLVVATVEAEAAEITVAQPQEQAGLAEFLAVAGVALEEMTAGPSPLVVWEDAEKLGFGRIR